MKSHSIAFFLICLSILTPASSAESQRAPLAETLKRFASDDTDYAIYFRPRRFTDSTFAVDLAKNSEDFAKGIDWLNKIEFFAGLATSKTSKKEGPKLLRFRNAIPIQKLIDTAESQHWSSFEFKEVTWSNQPVWVDVDEKTVAMLQIDDATVLISTPANLKNGLRQPYEKPTVVDHWLQKFEQNQIDAELIIVGEFEKRSDSHESTTISPEYKIFEDMKSIFVQIDVTHDLMLKTRIRTNDESSAQKLQRSIDGYIALGALAFGGQMHGTLEERSQDGDWFVANVVKALNSVEVKRDRNELLVNLNRPENWDEFGSRIARVYVANARREKQRPLSPIETKSVVVAKKQLESGQRITADDVQIEEWPADRFPQGGFTDSTPILTMKINRRIYKGEPIKGSMIADFGADFITIPANAEIDVR